MKAAAFTGEVNFYNKPTGRAANKIASLLYPGKLPGQQGELP